MGNAGCTDQRVRYVVCRYLYGTPECVAVNLMVASLGNEKAVLLDVRKADHLVW